MRRRKSEINIDSIIKKIQTYNPNTDADLLRLAYDFAAEAHQGQKRLSGEPYVNHCLATADKLADFEMDDATIAAGLLHDVPEDTDHTLEQVKKEFGNEIAFLVEGITKLGQVKYRGMERYVENLRRMFVAMAQDIRVILIKFADRMHNLNTLDAHPPYKRYRIALETLEIYAPIANRLGIGEIKGQLEDLSFPHVYEDEFAWLNQKIKHRFKEQERYVGKFQKDIAKILGEHGIKYDEIHGRAKHLFSLYRKLLHYNRDITKIYDLVALRVIVDDVAACYAALGVIHNNCKPLKGRIKDYIAQPKPNGYQSLHTTVFTPQGKIVEIQIRTTAMHREAEYGIAAHWHYKEKNDKKVNKEKLMWINELAKMQKELKGEKQYLETLKIDIFQTHIFVFTPKGDVIDLPEDATPIDFAYHIHTEIGHKCVGARVNDQISSLNAKLRSGDVVEIFTDKNRQGPSADWLDFVKTNTAQNHVRQWFKRNQKSRLQKLLHFKDSKN